MSAICEQCGKSGYAHTRREIRVETDRFRAKRVMCGECDEVLARVLRQHLRIPPSQYDTDGQWIAGTILNGGKQ